MLLVIHDKKVVDHFQVGGMLAQIDQSILYCGLLGKSQDFVGHDATCCSCIMAQQVANRLCFDSGHQIQEMLSLGLGNVRQDVGSVVRSKPLEQVGCTLGI